MVNPRETRKMDISDKLVARATRDQFVHFAWFVAFACFVAIVAFVHFVAIVAIWRDATVRGTVDAVAEPGRA